MSTAAAPLLLSAGQREALEQEYGLAEWGKVAASRGRKASIAAETISRIVELTTTSRPAGHTHWSCRTMAAQVEVSPATVQRIWSELGLQPHRMNAFKVSNNPHFNTKLVDVVGLYLNPPTRAVVLCMGEKSQIQALDRSQAVSSTGFDGDHQSTEEQEWRHRGSTPRNFGSARSG